MNESLSDALWLTGRAYLLVVSLTLGFFARTAFRLAFDPPRPKFSSGEILTFALASLVAALTWPVLLWESVRDSMQGAIRQRHHEQIAASLDFFNAATKKLEEHSSRNKEDPK